MAPVGLLQVVIVGDVNVVNLPGALVVGQVFPLDQVVHVSLFVEAATQETGGRGGRVTWAAAAVESPGKAPCRMQASCSHCCLGPWPQVGARQEGRHSGYSSEGRQLAPGHTASEEEGGGGREAASSAAPRVPFARGVWTRKS